MSTSEPRAFPFDQAPRLEVEPMFAVLRKREPVSRVRLPYGGDAWLVTRYEDVRTVLSDRRFGRAATAHPDVARIQPEPSSEGVLMSLDPPEHTRLRRTVAKAFTARRVAALRVGTKRIAEELLNAMVEIGAPADLVERYALPLPVVVICELLGVPYADRGEFLHWSDVLLSTTAYSLKDVAEARDAMANYFAGLIAQRRRQSTGDLLGELVRICDNESDRIGEDELASISQDLLVAGHETTASQITNFTYVLLNHPHERERLQNQPALMPMAVEELLRQIPLGSGGFRCRVATEEVELSGVRIQVGEAVFAPAISANFDETIFDDPYRLDLSRADNPHLSFGHGAHHCLGAQLARMELQVALSALLKRFPDLRLAVPETEIPWKAGMHIRAPQALPVRW